MDWAALNEAPTQAEAFATASAKRTTEAEESRLASAYESALRNAANGDRASAIDALRRVLTHPMTNARDLSARLTRVKFLALKNLGRFLEDETLKKGTEGENAAADADSDEALRCYAAAVEIDDEDAMLWRRLGSAATRRGEFSVARMAYERGVRLSAKNQLLLEDLCEICHASGDYESAKGYAREVVKLDPTNARAKTMKRAPEELEVSRALKAARASFAPSTPDRGDGEVEIHIRPSAGKTWEVVAGILARLGGVDSPTLVADEKTPEPLAKEPKDDEAEANDTETARANDADEVLLTPMNAAPSKSTDQDEDADGDMIDVSFIRSVEGLDIPKQVQMGKQLRFVFEASESDAPKRSPSPPSVQENDQEMRDADKPDEEEPPVSSQQEDEPEASQKTSAKSSKKGSAAPVRKSRRQEELDAKRAIEEEKARILAEEERAVKEAEAAAKKKAIEAKKWKPEANIGRALLKLVGAEDPVVAAVKAATSDVAAAAERAQSMKKKHIREMKEAAAKKAEEARRKKSLKRVSSFVADVAANGGPAHVAWRFLSTTAARWRPDTEDDCSPTPSMLITLYQIYGVGPGDELASRTRILLCLSDTAVLAARASALGQPSRKFFRDLAEDFLKQASIEMDANTDQDFQTESLFLHHKIADLDGEEPSVSNFYLDRAQEVALDDNELPSPPKQIEDAAPTRFSKQSLRAALDAMKVKEVVTGAGSRFAKGQTAELVSTLTPLLLPDEDQEITEGLDTLQLTLSEKQDALKVLAAAAKKEGPSCIVVELKALKGVYDFTKDHVMLRLMAEAIESSGKSHAKLALETAESLNLQAIATSLFEVHYNEFAHEPGGRKGNKISRQGAANMEASARLIAAIQYASKAKDAIIIDLHEKLHLRLADCRCCCGEGRKGSFLKSSLVQMASMRNRITKAREQRHASEHASKARTTKVKVTKRVQEDVDATADDDEEGGSRRRGKRQRSKISSVEDDDRTPQDKAERQVLQRVDKLIVQLCYCLYGFELEAPSRKCRDEGGACETTLHITSERDAADLWLAVQPYATKSEGVDQEQIAGILKAIRVKISDPPKTSQSTLITNYLTSFSDYLEPNMSVEQVDEKERALARELISQPTADQIVTTRKSAALVTPKKGGVPESVPPSPLIEVSTDAGIQKSEERLLEYAEVYKTFFQFCYEVDVATLEKELEDEQTGYDALATLLDSCEASGSLSRKWLNAEEGVSMVADQASDVTRLLKFDIEYNPTRPQSWIALADHIDNIKDIVLNDAATIISVQSFRSAPIMQVLKRCQLAIRRSLIAAEEALIMTHYPGHPETEWVRSQIYERLGQTSYELLQEAPPVYDGRVAKVDKTSPDFAHILTMCKNSFSKSAEGDKDNWIYPYFLAKLAKKQQEPLAEVLQLHARGLSAMPGSLEALYQVTNIRLRMLLSIPVNERKKMTPTGQALTVSVLKHPYMPEDMPNSWIGAYRDCIEALLFINKTHPKFHKAAYRLAWARLKKSPGEIGHARKALEYVMPLFRDKRNARPGSFKVNMVEIDDANLRIKVPETPPVDANGDPKVVHECGISESRRRYIANVRRAARLTLSLLYMNEDVQTISSAISYMVTGKVTSQKRVSVMAHSRDVRFFAIGLLIRATASTLSKANASSTDDLLASQRGEGVPEPSGEDFLEYAYNLWYDFAIPTRGNLHSWEENVSEAIREVQAEEEKEGSGPSLIQKPYWTAFYGAADLSAKSESLNFEKYVLDRIRLLEEKGDMNTLAAQLSLCQNRFKEFESDAAPDVIELGTTRLRTMVNAFKDAFIRCSLKTIDQLASGQLALRPGGVEGMGEDSAKEKTTTGAGEDKDEPEAIASPQKTALNYSEIVLVTARRLHTATKQESTQRVNDFVATRRATLTKYTSMIEEDGIMPTEKDLPKCIQLLMDIHLTMRRIEELKLKHSELVEKALVAENQTTDPEQLKLVRAAYEELSDANAKLAQLNSDHPAELNKYRDETNQMAQEMAKEVLTAESAEYLLSVVSAIERREITDLAEAETLAETLAADLRKLGADIRKKAGKSRSKSKQTENAAEAEVEEPTNDAAAAAAAAPAPEDAQMTDAN